MLPLFSLPELRAIEQHHDQLMDRAGFATADFIERRFSRRDNLLFLAGPGNNGGDAFAAAAHLKSRGFNPVLVYLGATDSLTADSEHARQHFESLGGKVLRDIPEDSWDLIVDGLFGIGLARPISGFFAEVVGWLNRETAPVLALDVPSGLDAFTGRVTGSLAVEADWTLTFIGMKPGLLTGRDAALCGQVFVDELGLADELPEASGHTLSPDDLAGLIEPRQRAGHKGSYGSVGILGGANGMTGAALLAGRTALYAGAGRVYVGLIDPCLAVDPVQPELMLRPAPSLFDLENLSALVVGPGLGVGSAAMQLLDWALRSPLSLVLDADALNLIAQYPALKERLIDRHGATLLTPHPAEAARLLYRDTAEIEADRIAAAQAMAAEYHAAIVLKGSGSVIAFPDGEYLINTTGNPGQAAAGQGDVLAGLLGALLAQGLHAGDALLVGVNLHGAAADRLVAQGVGPIGLTAGEMLAAIRQLLNEQAYAAENCDDSQE